MKGKTTRNGPPKRKLVSDIIQMFDNLKELENGNFEGYGENHNWTHKSCLWELPYTKALLLPHNIDLMHHEHSVVERLSCSLWSSFVGSQKNCKGKSDSAMGYILFDADKKKRDTKVA
jgi:hypothetical protein